MVTRRFPRCGAKSSRLVGVETAPCAAARRPVARRRNGHAAEHRGSSRPAGTGIRARAGPGVPLRGLRLRRRANLRPARVRTGAAPRSDGADGIAHRDFASTAAEARVRAAAHAGRGGEFRVVRPVHRHAGRRPLRSLTAPGRRRKPPHHPGEAARTACRGAVRPRPANRGGANAPESTPGARSCAEDGQLPERNPRAPRSARSRRGRCAAARHPGAGHRSVHLGSLSREGRRRDHSSAVAGNARGRHARAATRHRARRGRERARRAARNRRARGSRRGLRHQHRPRSHGRHVAQVAREPRAGLAAHRGRKARTDDPAATRRVPAIRGTHAPAMTTRRSFLAWAGAALAACARAFQREEEREPSEISGEAPVAPDSGASAPAAPAEAAPGAAPRSDLFAGAPAADDPLELLYSRRLSFEGGEPLVTVRVAEGRREMVVAPRGPFSVRVRAADGSVREALAAAEAGSWTVRVVSGRPGAGSTWVELEQFRFTDKEGVDRTRFEWNRRGVRTRVATVGQVYGVAGHVVDTRRYALLAEGDGTQAGARAQAKDLAERFPGVHPQMFREEQARPSGQIELADASGAVRAAGESALELRGAAGIAVEQVEFGMGYAFHGFETRTYPGTLYATVDPQGLLALVAAVPMERLVKGVVPSEIFASAHLEALKAQAVTARGEVLAKVGARHLGDPYLLCAEQHCQVYKGTGAETRSTDAAVDATRGEALFARVRGDAFAEGPGIVSRLV